MCGGKTQGSVAPCEAVGSFHTRPLRRVAQGCGSSCAATIIVCCLGSNQDERHIAESRLLELDITSGMFGGVFTSEQGQRMEGHIRELK
jgi:hypothetical protein